MLATQQRAGKQGSQQKNGDFKKLGAQFLEDGAESKCVGYSDDVNKIIRKIRVRQTTKFVSTESLWKKNVKLTHKKAVCVHEYFQRYT